jgi:hypothetical protein
MRMDHYQRSGSDHYREAGQRSDFGHQLLNLGQSFVTYIKTRQPEHWLFFAVGIIVGLWIS